MVDILYREKNKYINILLSCIAFACLYVCFSGVTANAALITVMALCCAAVFISFISGYGEKMANRHYVDACGYVLFPLRMATAGFSSYMA